VRISKKEIKELLKEAFFEVLSEQELKTASQEIIGKFPTLKRQLVALFTTEYEEFIGDVKWVAPKPTTFEVELRNGEKFFLKWNGAGFEAQIAGKKYMLNYVSEFQQALDKLNELLKSGKLKSQSDLDSEAEDAAEDEFGGGDDFGGGDALDEPAGGADDLGDEPEEEGEDIEFEEPGEEPEA